jgi:HAD superfamily hydrolase (TIGR01509 family)
MKAIFFGSIGTIAETSHLQLQAFNAAFEFHKLDWHWSREAYAKMLKLAGGAKRIETYALLKNEIVDAKKIHDTKSRIFRTLMSDTHIEPRYGVRDIIDFARNERLKLGFVTTTSRKNVDQVLSATQLMPSTFDVMISADQVALPKPSASAYNLALKKLGLLPHDVIAVEDNRDGYRSAKSADIKCFVNPGAFHDESVFDAADDISADPAGCIMSAVKHTIAA